MPRQDRTISGPDSEFVTPDELRRFVSLPEEAFERLVEEGVVPPMVRVSQRTLLHPWQHAVYLAIWLREFGPAHFARWEAEKKKSTGS